MKRYPRSMTDEELVRALSLVGWEEKAGCTGCVVSILASLVLGVLVCGWIGTDSLLVFGIVFVLGGVFVMAVVQQIVGFRGRAYAAELRRRYGQIPLRELLQDVVAAFRGENPPSRILLGRANAPVGSCTVLIVAELFDGGPRRGRVKVRIGPQFATGLLAPGEERQKERRNDTRELTDQEAEELADLLATATTPAQSSTPSSPWLSFRFEIAVLTGVGHPAFQGECDVLATPRGHEGMPAARLTRALLKLAEPTCDSRLLWGWADVLGDAGRRGFHHYVDEARRELAGTTSVDSILLFQGWRGGNEWNRSAASVLIRIWLTNGESPSARIETVSWTGAGWPSSTDGAQLVVTPGIDAPGAVPAKALRREESELPAEAVGGILEVLASANSQRLTSIPVAISGGFPCEVAIVERAPARVRRGACNLMGIARRHENLPTVVLAQILLKTAESACPNALVRGWFRYVGVEGPDPFMLGSVLGELTLPGAPDWLVLLYVSTEPGERRRSVRVDLFDAAVPSASIVVENDPEASSDEPRDTVERVVGKLGPEDASRLLDHLRSLRVESRSSARNPTCGEMSCRIMVVRRQSLRTWSGVYNLADVQVAHRNLPMVVLCRVILELAEPLFPQQPPGEPGD